MRTPRGYVTAAQYARKHRVSENVVFMWLHTMRLPYIRWGTHRLIARSAEPPDYEPRSTRGRVRMKHRP